MTKKLRCLNKQWVIYNQSVIVRMANLLWNHRIVELLVTHIPAGLDADYVNTGPRFY